MSAVVHHGGAGTTAEGLRAGKPTIICPTYINDQLFWGRRVFELGVGPKPIPQKKLTTEALSLAIRDAVADAGMRVRAEELGVKIRAEPVGSIKKPPPGVRVREPKVSFASLIK